MKIGVFKREVLTAPMQNCECPSCKATNTLKITVSHEFFNFGLPWFATGKKFTINCENCKKAFAQSEIPDTLYPKANEIVQSTKYSKWMFLMPIIMGIMIPFVFYKMYSTRKDNLQKIERAQIGDSYEIKLSEDNYTVFKVIKSTKDSVFFVASKFEVDYQGLDELHKSDESTFSEEIIGYSKDDLRKMNSNDRIQGIVREEK